MFKKVLVANRGEIAIRIIRALQEMNIASVAVYSDEDKNSLHRIYADCSFPLQGVNAADTYMNMHQILAIALRENVDAVHPGYGFLSENVEFARMLAQHSIAFIGPHPDTIARMGNKIAARKMMLEIGVPTIPGSNGDVKTLEEALDLAEIMGYPLLIKAASGGRGMGLEIVRNKQELVEKFDQVSEKAGILFGDRAIFIEKFLENARHIEFQILADQFGNVLHLGERECSIQRRHQKILEESPSMALDITTRNKMEEAALKIAQALGYYSAGTIEFLYSAGKFYFIEMNTRLQAEHPVTEMVTGIDIVKMQIKIAAGLALPYRQHQIYQRGHAIECRICAEDPLKGFVPSPEKIYAYRSPGGIGVRVDSVLHYQMESASVYDSMISKLVIWAETREEAIQRMKRALREYEIQGPKTNLAYMRAIMENESFCSGNYNTRFVAEEISVLEKAKRYAVQRNNPQDNFVEIPEEDVALHVLRNVLVNE